MGLTLVTRKILLILKNVNRSQVAIVVFIILLGGIFRYWGCGTHNFNGDESAHIRKAVSVARGMVDLFKGPARTTGWQNIYLTIMQHNHPPLEFLLLIPAVPFANREFYARFIYITINIVFLLFNYFLSRKIYGRKFALYLLILLSTSTYFIWASRFATHDSLSIIISTLIGLSVINLYKTDNLKQAITLLFFSLTLGLLSFVNFIFYLPFILLILIERFKGKNIKIFIIPTCFFIIINGLFYLPYIIYSFSLFAPSNAGFNYYLGSKTKIISLDIIKNLQIFYRGFFSKSGVFPLWVFALIGGLTLTKYKFIKFFNGIIITLLVINLIKLTTLNFYMEFYGLMVIIAVLWLIKIKKAGKILLILGVVFALYGNINIIKGDYSKATAPVIPATDKLKIIGEIAKKCLVNNESYISTAIPWRTFYYFGRPVLPEVEGGFWTPLQAVEQYTNGKLQNEVTLIHFSTGQLPISTIEKIRVYKEYTFGDDHLLILKQCDA